MVEFVRGKVEHTTDQTLIVILIQSKHLGNQIFDGAVILGMRLMPRSNIENVVALSFVKDPAARQITTVPVIAHVYLLVCCLIWTRKTLQLDHKTSHI